MYSRQPYTSGVGRQLSLLTFPSSEKLLRLRQSVNCVCDAQLTTEERLYLHAARVGDYGLLRDILETATVDEFQWSDLRRAININCVDYMGRSALHLAVDSENMESIELLLDQLSWQCHDEVARSLE